MRIPLPLPDPPGRVRGEVSGPAGVVNASLPREGRAETGGGESWMAIKSVAHPYASRMSVSLLMDASNEFREVKGTD